MDKIMDLLDRIWSFSLVRFALFTIVAVVASLIAKFLVKKWLQALPIADGAGKKPNFLWMGKLVCSLVFLLFVPTILNSLNLTALSQPISDLVARFLDYLPRLVAAGVVIWFGILLTNVLCGFLYQILKKAKLDETFSKYFSNLHFNPTKTTVDFLRVVLVLLAVAEGLEVLALELLTTVAGCILSFLPSLIKSALILLAASLASTLLTQKLFQKSPFLQTMARGLIFVLAVFMIFSELKIATAIVNPAFLILLGAGSLAFVLAFGLGGQDFAKTTLNQWMQKANQNNQNKQ